MDFWHLTHSDWFEALPQTAKDSITSNAHIKLCNSGDALFEPEPSPHFVYFVETGIVSLYRYSLDGEQVTFGFVNDGHIFGEIPLFANAARETFAMAMEPSKILRIEKDSFMGAIGESCSSILKVTSIIAGKTNRYQRRIEDLVFKSVRARLASIIIEIGEDFGIKEGETCRIPVHFTQSEYAQLIGASRPSVNIAFGELQRDKIIDLSRDALIILSSPELQDVAVTDKPRKTLR